MSVRYDRAALDGLDPTFRLHFMNTLSGWKSLNLIGTQDAAGRANLAVFSSVTHLGSHPPAFGFFTRRKTTPRDTLLNLRETGAFTFNHVPPALVPAAHGTSAAYPREVSEFEQVGLTPELRGAFPAPFVAEAPVQVGLELVEEHELTLNGVILVVGAVVEVHLADGLVGPDGWIDLERAGTVCATGCDTYAAPRRIARFARARPGEPPQAL